MIERVIVQGAVLIDRSAEGRLELRDRDRLDLLQRMSTNDLRDLADGDGRSTVLTTALARIIDRLTLYAIGAGDSGSLMVMCGVGRAATVRGWLARHIFFQDKVQLRDLSAETVQFGLFGPNATEIVRQFVPAAADLALHQHRTFVLDGHLIRLARTYPLAGDGYTLIAPMAARESLLNAFGEIADVQMVEGTEAESQYEQLRIAYGLPASGHELTEEYLPLEAGLWDSISFKKGCYTGQEIIARMESRHQLARTIVQYTLSTMVLVGTAIARQTQPDQPIGVITSAAAHPDGTCRALGYVKMDALNDPLLVIGAEAVKIELLFAVGWQGSPSA